MTQRRDWAQEDALAAMRSVLAERYLALKVRRYVLEEDFDAATSRVEFWLALNEAPAEALTGVGVGLIDALFGGLRARFAAEHPSLESVSFSSLHVRGLACDGAAALSTAAQVEARVGVRNSYGNVFDFAVVSESVSRSSVSAVVAAVEYFVNAERAYVALFMAREQAARDGRPALVEQYTSRLSEMVRNTSYSAGIERLRAVR